MSVTKEFRVVIEDSIKKVPHIDSLVDQAMILFSDEVFDKMRDDETSEREIRWDYHPEVDSGILSASYQELDYYGLRKVSAAVQVTRFNQRWQQKVFLLDLMLFATRAKSKQVRAKGNELLAQLEREEDEDAKSKCD